MADRSGDGVNPMVPILGAILLVVACVGGYVWVNWTGPVHSGQVVSVAVYPIHRELSTGEGMGGLKGAPNVYDETIVLADVKIKSTTKLPLFLHDMWGDLTLQDGTSQRDLAASGDDFQKVFLAYPALKAQEKNPVPRDLTLQPGQEVDGQMVFHYPVSKQQWDSRQSFTVTVEFLHQKPLVMTTTAAETVTLQ